MILCVRRLRENGSPVILIINCVLWSVFYCVLLSASAGQYTE